MVASQRESDEGLHRRAVLGGLVATARASKGRAALCPGSIGDRRGSQAGGRARLRDVGPGRAVSSIPGGVQGEAPCLDVSSGYYSPPTGRVLARVSAELAAGRLTFDVLHVASLKPLAPARPRAVRRRAGGRGHPRDGRGGLPDGLPPDVRRAAAARGGTGRRDRLS